MSSQGGQMVKRSDAAKEVEGLIEKMRPAFEAALPKIMRSDRFQRVVLTALRTNPALLDCTRHSLLGSLMECAQLGLEPGVLGQAYLVPYKGKATLIVGYKGLINLARRSGQVSSISAHVVHQADEFDFGFGDSPFIKHRPSPDDNPGEIEAAYAVAILTDGSKHMEVMWRRQIDAIRERSMARNNGPWVTDYEEMARKTVVRRLCKYLPLSVELQTAVALDEQADAGLPQQLDYSALPSEALPPVDSRSALDRAAEDLGAAPAEAEGETPNAPSEIFAEEEQQEAAPKPAATRRPAPPARGVQRKAQAAPPPQRAPEQGDPDFENW